MKKKALVDKTSQKVIISILVIVLLSVAQIYIWRWVETLSDDLHNQRTLQQQITNLESQLEQLAAQAGSQAEVNSQIQAVTIQEGEISQAIERLEQKAQQFQLVLSTTSIVTEQDSDSAYFSPLVITASVQGPVGRVLQYLEGIEHLTEVTHIRDFSLTANSRPAAITGEDIHTLSFNVVFMAEKTDSGDTPVSRRAFVSNVTPGAPGGGSSRINIGTYVISGSVLLLLIAFGYKVRERQRI
jgi:Tfp pilus assembly protein PilO